VRRKNFPGRQAGLLAGRFAANFPAFQILRCAPAARSLAVIAAPIAVSTRVTSQERILANQPTETIMAITLGTFTKFDNGAYTGILKTLHVTVPVSIVPVDKMSDKAPDHRVYAGQRHEIGAGWSQTAKSSGETYINLKIACPEFGPHWVRCRLVKLEQPAEDGATHMALWEPRDR
jgi:uncharacterized protein (DUF736 family)